MPYFLLVVEWQLLIDVFIPPLYASTTKSVSSPLGLRNGGRAQIPHHLPFLSPHFPTIATYYPPISPPCILEMGGEHSTEWGGENLRC